MSRKTGVTRRAVCARLGVLAGAGALAACSRPGEEAAPAAHLPVEIEFWHANEATHRYSLLDTSVIEGFHAANPNKFVKVTASDIRANDPKVVAAMAAGTPPNMMVTAQGVAATYLNSGGVVDVETELKGNRDWTRFKSELIPMLLEAYRWKGKLAGVPVFGAYEGMGINTGLLQRAGLPMPKKDWTWDDYVELGRKVARPPDVWLGYQQFDNFNYWHESNLAYPTNKDQTRVTVSAPENVETLEFKIAQAATRQLETRTLAPPGLNITSSGSGAQDQTYFGQGQQLAQTVNPGAINPPRYPGISIAVTHYPSGPNNKKREISLGSSVIGYMVFKVSDAAKQHVAAEVALHAIRPTQQLTNSQVTGQAPGNVNTLKSAAFANLFKDNKVLTDLFALAPFVTPFPSFPGWPEAQSMLGVNLKKAANGEMSARDALKEVEPRMQAVLDKALG
jgi:ABC-type glycerol-3-phosphate transport system substrate-binding protein